MAQAGGLHALNDVLTRTDAMLEKYAIMGRLQEKTGLRKSHIAGVGAFCLTMFLFFGLGMEFLCNLVGFTYPAYQSFRALETRTNAEDDKKWLMYWVIFAFMTLMETFSMFIVTWFPPYYALKLAFLVFLFLPYTNGAEFIYNNFLAPFLRNHFAAAAENASSKTF